MDRKTRTTGTAYRGEAAELFEAAARSDSAAGVEPFEIEPFEVEPFPAARPSAAPPVEPQSRRPLPYPEPVGINDNLQGYAPLVPLSERPHVSAARIVAWIVIAPWYLAVAATSIGVDFLFAKSLLGF